MINDQCNSYDPLNSRSISVMNYDPWPEAPNFSGTLCHLHCF